MPHAKLQDHKSHRNAIFNA